MEVFMFENEPLFVEVLPHRPAPYPGECLSGYLVRLAEANGFTMFWDLARDLFVHMHKVGHLPLLRWEYPLDNWERLQLRTHLSLTQLRGMSVAPWFEKFHTPVLLTRPGNSSPGRWLQGAVRPDLAICAQCLREEPYVRLLWRLAPIRVCLKHGGWLQGQCSQCSHTLRTLSARQHPLRCVECGMDLRQLPVMPAPEDVLEAQTRRQTELQFLLKPEVSLVEVHESETEPPALDLPKAIGRKFRFLRQQAGLTQTEIGKQIGVAKPMVGLLERGEAPLVLYLSYLQVFSLSWSNFADLPAPLQSKTRKEPAYLTLRVCPNSQCLNRLGPTLRVRLEEDLPASRMARFRCLTCGHHFTRTYEGQLVTKRHDPPARRINPRIKTKSLGDVLRVLELGKQGLTSKEIAPLVGWSATLVCHCWSALDAEEEIRQAKFDRRLRERQSQQIIIHAGVEQCLETWLRGDKEITLARVRREVPCSPNFLRQHPELVEHIHKLAQVHNALVRQRREEALKMQLQQVLIELKQRGNAISIREATERVGWIASSLVSVYPTTYAMVRQVVAEHNAALQVARHQKELALINEAAARLVAQSIRLTQGSILREAGLSLSRMAADPLIHKLLDHWIGDPISRR